MEDLAAIAVTLEFAGVLVVPFILGLALLLVL